jgi:hypothetical protein
MRLPLLKTIAFFKLVFFVCVGSSQTAEFKVQHLQDDVSRAGGSNTAFTTVNSLNSVIELANNNRKSHAGSNTHSGGLEGDDMAGARQLTATNTLTYFRESSSRDVNMRFNTSLWEYIGPAAGNNEFIVRGRFALALNGGTSSVTQALIGVVDANKCIPFITGILNDATSNDADSGTALAYLENANTLRVQKGSDDNDVTVYITVVEFTGANWTVLHGDSGDVGSDTGTITLRDNSDGTGNATDVTDWSNAVIFSHFRADDDSGDNDAIADLWPIIDPGGNNQTVDWTFHSNHDSDDENRHFVHVLVNTGLNVTRYQDFSRSSGETIINIASSGLSDINQAFIVGNSTSSGNGNAYGRGWRNYYLKSTTQAAHWAHRNNNTLSHEIQIVDLSGLQTSYVGPEINITGNGVSIPDGNVAISVVDDTDFGELEVTGAVTASHTFTIQNLGTTNLTLDDPSPYITLTGDTTEFTLTANPTTPIAAAGSTTFTITYDPTTSGIHTATVSIANNDTDENPYTFLIMGRGDYCASNGSTSYDTSVTYVSFNTLTNADNEDPKDNAYEDFTDMSTYVYRNTTHNLTVRVNTDGNYTIYTNVWIDWNNDGDWDDAGEEYDMGAATNVSDGEPTNSPMAITIPSNAVIGSVGMRVATKWASYPSSCESGFDGEVEDYTVNVIDYLIDFDGANEYVNFGDNHDLTGSFSLESWVFQENSVTTGTIISNGNIDAGLKTGYHLSLQNNYPNFTWYDGANNEIINITSSDPIPNNEWHHVAATYDGAIAKLYVDGVEMASDTTVTSPVNTPQNFKVGAETVNYNTTPVQVDYFDGAIQEVRVWDVALTQNQIRVMMNQHIEQNTTNVKGSVIPLDITGGLLWSNLLGYYPLDSNTAFDSSSYGIDGTPVDITLSQNATAPLPYETDDDNNWDTSSTWLNGDDLYIPNSLSIDGTTSIDWNIVDLTNNITSQARDITLLALISTVGTLTISGTTTSNIGTGQALTVTNYLELDGVIDLEGGSQLIQEEGSILDADSGGYIERDQQGTANAFNYNYWSSSVCPISGDIHNRGTGVAATNANYSISNVLFDGTNSAAYQNINFDTSPYAADANTPPSPITISTYWMYKFYGAADDFSAWVSIDETSSLTPAEGFTMKGSSGQADTATAFQNYVFRGLPNNGDITIALDKSPGNVDRLIGNPYPSALDATQFILDNMSIADGGNNASGTIFNGALYFWDHFGEENSHSTSGYVGGYATRNLIGGAAAISNDDRVNNSSNGGNPATGTKVPGQYVAVNQGFFVSTALDGFDNNNAVPISIVDGGDVVFKNSQRVFVTEQVPNTSQFIRAKKDKANTEQNETEDFAHPTITFLYHSPNGYLRQVVLGARKEASDNFDFGYDAFVIDINDEDMYWLLDDKKLVIQGVKDFVSSKEFPLGLKAHQNGIATISIDNIEGIEEYIDIFIYDKNTDTYHDIKNAPFVVNLESGTYDDRFKVVFENFSLKDEEEKMNDLQEELLAYFNKESSEIVVNKEQELKIRKAILYNAMGQRVRDIEFINDRARVNLSTGIYIIQFYTSQGRIVKKIKLQ